MEPIDDNAIHALERWGVATESKLSIAVAALERITGNSYDEECENYIAPYTCMSENDPQFCSNCFGSIARHALQRIKEV